MKISLKSAIALSLLPQIFLVKFLGTQPQWIEQFYSQGIYPRISSGFRSLLGWIPFSVGDLLYIVLGIIALYYVLSGIRKRSFKLRSFLRDVFMVLAVAYFTFHFMWGMNYYRQPLADTLELEVTYTQEELITLTENLIFTANTLQESLSGDSVQPVQIPYSQKEILKKTLVGYKELAHQYSWATYKPPSLKKSLISTPLTYMGYGGYLNPFTNEAQVNSRLPGFRFPVVCGHEVGHQLGYSAENETNFIGYLVTGNHPDDYFKYSAAAYALGYCLQEIQLRDQTVYKELLSRLNAGLMANYAEMNAFWESFQNPLEPMFKSIFNTFLKANSQKEGIRSYNRIVGLLVAYHRKNPL